MINDKITSVVDDINHIIQVLNSYEEGTISIGNTGGEVRSIEVVTRRAPEEVWIKLNNEDNYASCNSERNWIDYETTFDGFILYANVASEVSQIQWYAAFSV